MLSMLQHLRAFMYAMYWKPMVLTLEILWGGFWSGLCTLGQIELQLRLYGRGCVMSQAFLRRFDAAFDECSSVYA